MKRLLLAPLMLFALVGVALAQTDPKLDSTGPAPEFQPQVTTPSVESGQGVADLGPGDDAPDFKVESSVGTPIRLADLKGHVSVLLFATDPEALANFAAANDSLYRQGIRSYGICELSKKDLEATAKRMNIAFPVMGDPNGDFARSFGMYDPDEEALVPGVIVIDPKGVIRLVAQGLEPHAESVLSLIRHAKLRR